MVSSSNIGKGPLTTRLLVCLLFPWKSHQEISRVVMQFNTPQNIASLNTTFNLQITLTHKMNTRAFWKVRTRSNWKEASSLNRNSDSEWNKEETDYLFSVVQDFDSRWYIIYDRYDYPTGPTRSLEVRINYGTKQRFLTIYQDLKDRYYSVCRKLVRNRPWAGDETGRAQLLSSFQFDKGQ